MLTNAFHDLYVSFRSYSDFFFNSSDQLFANVLNWVFFAQGRPGEGDLSGDTLLKMFETLDITGLKNSISGLVRALGFGPEADGIAIAIIIILFVLMLIGYAAGPKTTAGSDTTTIGTGTSTGTGVVGKEADDKRPPDKK